MCAVAAERPLLVAWKNRRGEAWEAAGKRDGGSFSLSVLLFAYVPLVRTEEREVCCEA